MHEKVQQAPLRRLDQMEGSPITRGKGKCGNIRQE